jgi:hypothetical protein
MRGKKVTYKAISNCFFFPLREVTLLKNLVVTHKIQKPLNLVLLCEFSGYLDETHLEFSRLIFDLGDDS